MTSGYTCACPDCPGRPSPGWCTCRDFFKKPDGGWGCGTHLDRMQLWDEHYKTTALTEAPGKAVFGSSPNRVASKRKT